MWLPRRHPGRQPPRAAGIDRSPHQAARRGKHRRHETAPLRRERRPRHRRSPDPARRLGRVRRARRLPAPPAAGPLPPTRPAARQLQLRHPAQPVGPADQRRPVPEPRPHQGQPRVDDLSPARTDLLRHHPRRGVLPRRSLGRGRRLSPSPRLTPASQRARNANGPPPKGRAVGVMRIQPGQQPPACRTLPWHP